MSLTLGSRHLSDEDLIRYMDHQLDREGARRTRAHLGTCPECAARLEAAQSRNAAVRELLTLLPAPEPDPTRRAAAQAAMDRARFRRSASGPLGSRVFWQAAAASLVLLLLGLGTQPGRAFVAGAVHAVAGDPPGPVAGRVLDWLGETPQTAAAPVYTAPPPIESEAPRPRVPDAAAVPALPPGTSPPVRFIPAGPDVVLRFASTQNAGTAVVTLRESARYASGQVMADWEGERLEAGPEGLVVRNRAGSQADYEFVVPTRFRFLKVQVGNGPMVPIRISRSKQEWIWTINLQDAASPLEGQGTP
jgi:hypothetical protein